MCSSDLGAYKLDLSGESFDVNRDMLDIVIEAKAGFAAGLKGDLYVILDTEITEELEQEGIGFRQTPASAITPPSATTETLALW